MSEPVATPQNETSNRGGPLRTTPTSPLDSKGSDRDPDSSWRHFRESLAGCFKVKKSLKHETPATPPNGSSNREGSSRTNPESPPSHQGSNANGAQHLNHTSRILHEQLAAFCLGRIVSLVRCCFCYHWPWQSISLGERGMKIGPSEISEVSSNRAVYVNPVTSRLVRVKTSARVLELSEKNFVTRLGNFSLKPTICYRVSGVQKFLENVEDADKFVTSWVLKDVGYFLATSKSAEEATTGLQGDHLRFSSIARNKPGGDSKSPGQNQEGRNPPKDGNGGASQGHSSQPPQSFQAAIVQAEQAPGSQSPSSAQAESGQASGGPDLQQRPALQEAQEYLRVQTQDPHISPAQQPEYFRTISDEYGIEILWVEFRNTKYKKNRTWDVPETPFEATPKAV
ncbi:hypothetical protein BJX66DRAFT_298052 [Aspergillus keveii]|uniref:Uncharacterized protein n=1 Tax=Aspergillus keveii TaxID=714993 RepID=A0ABR4GE16_9EURO